MGLKHIAKQVVPEKYHWTVYNRVRDIVGWRSKSYSAFGEDLVVAKILENKKNGFYVDVGAFHPFKYSNTFYLNKYLGWNGINIEPNPQNFKLFEKYRPDDMNLNVGVSESCGELSYYMYIDGLYNTFDEERKKELLQTGLKPIEKKPVRVLPLSQILEERTQGRSIDFLNVDVEMLDLEVLRSNDWSLYKPTVIAIEDHGFEMESFGQSEIFRLLSSQGYRLESKCHFTIIYKLESEKSENRNLI